MIKPTIEHLYFEEWVYAEQCNYNPLNEIVFYYHIDNLFYRVKHTVAIFRIKPKTK